MCDLSDGEYCKVWREVTVKARKPHQCSCCKRTIAAGELYLRHFSVFEGQAVTHKMCSECEKDRDEFAKAHGGYLPSPGDVVFTISECIADGDEESERQWRPMLKRIKERRARAA